MDIVRLGAIALTVIADIGLGLTVYLRNRRNPANRAFAAAALVIVAWLALDFMADQPAFAAQALALNRFTIGCGLLMGGLLMYFTLVFPRREGPLGKGWVTLFAGGAALIVATLATDLVVAAVVVRPYGNDLVSGRLMPVVIAWVCVGVASVLWVLGSKARREEGRRKAQVNFMLLGLILFAVATVTLGLALPAITGRWEIARLNLFSTLLLLGFTAYAMVRHRFMDIRLVGLRAVVYTGLVLATAIVLTVPAVIWKSSGAPLGLGADIMFGVVALAAVLVFQPIRHFLEGATDRAFYRLTYDPDRLLEQLGSSITSTLDPHELGVTVVGGLTEMRVAFAAMAYFDDERGVLVAGGPSTLRVDAGTLLALPTRDALTVVDELPADAPGYSVLTERGVSVFARLIADDVELGVMLVGAKLSGEMYTPQDLRVLEIIRQEVSIAMKNARLYGDLESTFLGTIAALAATVDAKDPYTYGHSKAVTDYAVAIARKLGFDDDEVHSVRIAAMLHDIGKIAVDGAILNKTGSLTAEERAQMNRHPVVGADILAPLDFLKDVAPIILFHHERIDGGGYPSGVSGESIPMGARIVSAADAFNAMTSDRPYRPALTFEAAISELEVNAGTQFDPAVVRAFLDVLAESGHAEAALRRPRLVRQGSSAASVSVPVDPAAQAPAPRSRRWRSSSAS